MISTCICLSAAFNFRSFCRTSDPLNKSEVKFDHDIKKYNKRIKNYKTSDDNQHEAAIRAPSPLGDFHNLHDEPSEVPQNMDSDEEYESTNPIPKIRKEKGLKVEDDGVQMKDYKY